MTKQDLIKEVARRTNTNCGEVGPIVEAAIGAIKESVQRKEAVYLRGFGTFQPKKRAEKKARNISAGTSVIIPAHEVPNFKPSKNFTINK
ncbi:HU family DNA-binding protein [uncultured Alistipes sp.]|uniref:HU family DNA-binding protein n=1 Tax=uncultured Alistipes sp. TaxID=538949 RepID=UPI00263706A9|nr:HU family DNA-binding protein [uncultured Alistipes sp.]